MLPYVAIAMPKFQQIPTNFLPKFQGSSSSTEFQGIKELHAQLHPLHAPAVPFRQLRGKIFGNMKQIIPVCQWEATCFTINVVNLNIR